MTLKRLAELRAFMKGIEKRQRFSEEVFNSRRISRKMA